MMIIREIKLDEKERYNQAAEHPLQTWEWGEFRQETGLKVIRLGEFDQDELIQSYQLTVHPLPFKKLNRSVIWFPRGPMPHQQMLITLRQLALNNQAIYVKLEPNVYAPTGSITAKLDQVRTFLQTNGCQPGQDIFINHTFTLNLNQTTDELLAQMKPKTRYNLNLAQKAGIEVKEDNSETAFEAYLKLTKATTERQGFFAHTPDYHRQMWKHLHQAGIAHLLVASYQDQPLVTWVLFKHRQTLYYPYGASSRLHRDKMPVYAMMWAAIRFGQTHQCHTLDLWGSLGLDPDPQDPRFGFHRFKAGFGGTLQEYVGTWDLVVDQALYPIVQLGEKGRSKLLGLRKKLRLIKK